MAAPGVTGLPGPSKRLGAWFDLTVPGKVVLKTGKVELGQGIITALLQIAADELDLDFSQMEVVSGDTALSPFEGGTVGSMSLETSGPLVRAAAAELRQRLTQAAAMRAQLLTAKLTMTAGAFQADGTAIEDTIWSVAPDIDFEAVFSEQVEAKRRDQYRLVGTSPPQVGLAAKFAGAAYIHDVHLDGMLHGRILRKPHLEAHLREVNADKVASMPGVVQVVRERNLIGLLASNEHLLDKAMEKLAQVCIWDIPQADHRQTVQSILEERESVDSVLRDDAPASGDKSAETIEATFTKPLVGHGSIGPSCGLAVIHPDRVEVWSHSQTVFALRDQVARVLERPAETIRVRHAQAAGCYGHNGADDAAMDAVMLARAVPGTPVRVQWTRKDELVAEPLGSAMRVRVVASVANGRIAMWELETRSGSHIQRPGWNGGINLLSPGAVSEAWQSSAQADLPLHNGGSKNAVAMYDFPQRVTYQFVSELPFRLSALRSLGAFANVFAIEGMMDQLAEVAGVDPIEFRLSHISDRRARAVIERAAAISGWESPVEPGFGRGIGFARFKNSGSYCAVVALVAVEEEVELRGLWGVVDAGLAINPAGIVAQVEGGMIQAASWTLKEAVPTEGTMLTAESWRDYPILKFSEIPDVVVDVISDPTHESTGVGEVSLGPTAGAIGNAVAAALGVRIRDLPLTRDRVIETLMNA